MSLKIWGTNLRRPNLFIFSIGYISGGSIIWISWLVPRGLDSPWDLYHVSTCRIWSHKDPVTTTTSAVVCDLVGAQSCASALGFYTCPKRINIADKMTSQKETGLSNYWGNYDNTSLFWHTLANDFLRNGEQKSHPKQSKAAGKSLFVDTDRKRIRHVFCLAHENR